MNKRWCALKLCILAGCLSVLLLSCAQVAGMTKKSKAPFTLMIMMNGSDLESENSCATDDMMELIGSGFDAERLQVLLLTCGTSEWQNGIIPSEVPVIWKAGASGLEKLLEYAEPLSVGNPVLLSSFVTYCYENYPADRYGLMLWNHGGGPLLGYGSDELFDDDSLLLPDIATALASTPAVLTPFEFIGFDACLMGNLEIALVLQNYAGYLIASEETEPGTGWDYNVFRILSENPTMPIPQFCKLVVDSYIATNMPSDEFPTGDTATLSVIDLNKVEDVSTALEALARRLSPVTLEDYPSLARARYGLRSFGSGGPQSSDADLIDLGGLARQFESDWPEQCFALHMAVEDAIVYSSSTENLMEQASGLSVYFPFSEKEALSDYFVLYRYLDVLPAYTQFIEDFSTILSGVPLHDIEFFCIEEADDLFIGIEPSSLEYVAELYFELWQQQDESEVDGTYWYIQLAQFPVESVSEAGVIENPFRDAWVTLEDQFVCLYMLDRTPTGTRYAIPAYLNDEDVNIIVVYDETFPDGIVIGAVPVEQDAFAMPARIMLPLRSGDVIQLQYRALLMAEDDRELTDEEYADEVWYTGEPIVLSGRPVMGTSEVNPGKYRYCYVATDLQQNPFVSDCIAVMFEQVASSFGDVEGQGEINHMD
ncbi:MAG: clostripain-related cysteine peptidase [Sphaerochaetaceae bacterium]|nr:clostripain-related cysteine peptidase [Sphaerochaetaceae bacterium]